VTVTPGSTPPVVSVTVPVIVASWADATTGSAKDAATHVAMNNCFTLILDMTVDPPEGFHAMKIANY
jgi:hypothetical protein